MSFSSDVKTELCRTENRRDCCRRAECYGMWLFSRCFSLKGGAYVTESGPAARRMLELAAGTAGVSGELEYGLSRRKKRAYRVSLPEEDGRRRLLEAFGHSGREPSLKINRAVLENECCVRAFLRGAFLVCGAAADPLKEYRLEFAVPYKNLANSLYTLLSEAPDFQASPSAAERKGGYVVYLKGAEQIEDLLTFMGAPGASMHLMQVRMYKEAKNNINRKANFETANIDKTYSASARQIAAIAAISDAGGLGSLPQETRRLAELRLENPDMTLRELGEKLGMTRSGVNYRLKKLLEQGEKILKERGTV